MPKSDISDFFAVNQKILKLGALWRPTLKNFILNYLYTVYAIGTFLFVNVFFTSTEFISLVNTFGNEYDLIKNISFALTHLLGAFKVSNIMVNSHFLNVSQRTATAVQKTQSLGPCTLSSFFNSVRGCFYRPPRSRSALACVLSTALPPVPKYFPLVSVRLSAFFPAEEERAPTKKCLYSKSTTTEWHGWSRARENNRSHPCKGVEDSEVFGAPPRQIPAPSTISSAPFPVGSRVRASGPLHLPQRLL